MTGVRPLLPLAAVVVTMYACAHAGPAPATSGAAGIDIAAALRDRFVAIRVDIDERPDIAERYGDRGWPATIVLSPEAEELGKSLEDNVAAARFLAALGRAAGDAVLRGRAERALAASLTPDALDHQGSWLGAALAALDDVGAVPWPDAAR
jgi:hypothetical protein